MNPFYQQVLDLQKNNPDNEYLIDIIFPLIDTKHEIGQFTAQNLGSHKRHIGTLYHPGYDVPHIWRTLGMFMALHLLPIALQPVLNAKLPIKLRVFFSSPHNLKVDNDGNSYIHKALQLHKIYGKKAYREMVDIMSNRPNDQLPPFNLNDFCTLHTIEKLELNKNSLIYVTYIPFSPAHRKSFRQSLTAAEKSGVTILNSMDVIQAERVPLVFSGARDSKEMAEIFAHKNHPKVLRTELYDDAEKFFRSHKHIVLKPTHLSMGQEVYEYNIKNASSDRKIKKELSNFKAKFDDVLAKYNQFGGVILQEFVEGIHEFGDTRVVLINGKIFPVGATRMPKKGEFVAQLARGATIKPNILSQEILEAAIECANNLPKDKLFIAGLDVLQSKNKDGSRKIYITEINTKSIGLFEMCLIHFENNTRMILDAVKKLPQNIQDNICMNISEAMFINPLLKKLIELMVGNELQSLTTESEIKLDALKVKDCCHHKNKKQSA